jgi:hypothetical protein
MRGQNALFLSVQTIPHWGTMVMIFIEDRILMLLAYAKSSLGDLTPEQVRTLGKLAKQELEEFGNG